MKKTLAIILVLTMLLSAGGAFASSIDDLLGVSRDSVILPLACHPVWVTGMSDDGEQTLSARGVVMTGHLYMFQMIDYGPNPYAGSSSAYVFIDLQGGYSIMSGNLATLGYSYTQAGFQETKHSKQSDANYLAVYQKGGARVAVIGYYSTGKVGVLFENGNNFVLENGTPLETQMQYLIDSGFGFSSSSTNTQGGRFVTALTDKDMKRWDYETENGVCHTCHGVGTCPVCGGLRGISVTTYGLSGDGRVDCRGCLGTGQCYDCSGTGRQ